MLCLLLIGMAGTFIACANQDISAAAIGADKNSYTELQEFFQPDWAMNKLWDDGLAEVAIYDAERVVYDKKRSFEFTQITVKEDFNRAHNVKTDDYSRSDLFPVLKVNQFARIPTEKYPYHYLTSLFLHREQPWALHKLTTSSQEWCGNTFKAITDEGNSYQEYYNSYFDGQGEGHRDLPKNALFEDQLPSTLRALRFQDGLRLQANVVESLQNNKALAPVVYQAKLSTVKTDLEGQAAWQVIVRLEEGKQNTYWFASQYPNQLLQQETWDGRKLKLKQLSRYAYWQEGGNKLPPTL